VNIPTTITDPKKRYDFLVLFDVTDGNPNGDPDAGNLPRLDPETLQGIVTDVCLKRKIRNYIDLTGQGGTHDAGIFVRDSGIALNTKLREAAEAVGVKPDRKRESREGRAEMCKRYYDVRMFGGVLSTGDYNCGQVRGPMQLTFARSIDPIVPSELAITRVAITKEGEQKETEIGRKAAVPYGLYLGRGFYSPMLGDSEKGGTGVSKEDLEMFWTALVNMFELDRSAARGYMQMRGVYIFVHENPLGNAPSGPLFDRVKAKRRDGVAAPRRFDQYELAIDDKGIPQGVALERLMG
jgi:CRISPR-associated protein Csd2